MQRILPLRGVIKNYAWGSRTALAAWTRRVQASPGTEAELWLGAHPHGSAEVEVDGRWERLDHWLGREGRGARLPFLLKLLAVERPLSLQVHPDEEQAREGFAKEEGVSATSRRYADPFAKPELVCALTAFTALCGFRPADEVAARLGALGLGELMPSAGDEPSRLARFLGSWLAAPPAARRAKLALARDAARVAAAHDPASAWMLRLDAEHPDDPAVLAPLFLHLLELAPGEALFLPPGELHCYLGGVAVELMGSSDNVLRGGLTKKAVHVDELLRVARFAPRRPPSLWPVERGPGAFVYPAPTRDFELSLLEPVPERAVVVGERRGAEILWCAAGEVRIAATGEGRGIPCRRGESCLAPATTGAYRVEGEGRVYRAAVPSG